jgi:hypothetical protein
MTRSTPLVLSHHHYRYGLNITAKHCEIGFGGTTRGLEPGLSKSSTMVYSEAGGYKGRPHLDV